MYPLLNDKIPRLPAQSISGEELNKIKWDVEDEIVKPDHTSPTPSNSFNCSKAPVRIDSNQCSNLFKEYKTVSILIYSEGTCKEMQKEISITHQLSNSESQNK